MKKYQFITFLLIVYALFMTFYFGIDLLKSGQELRFYITLIAEAVVITLTFFALRKRDRLKKRKQSEQQ